MARVEGDVAFARRRRAAVRPGVDAQQGEVAGVARPAPVVDLAAVFAHRARRRVDQAHVGVLQPLDELIGHPAVEGLHLAAAVRLALAGRDQLLLLALDRPEARQVVGAGGHRRLDLGGDVRRAVGEGDAQPLARELVGARAGEEAVGDDVVARGRVLLQDAERAVVVGDHEALGGDEAARAAVAHLDRGGEEPGALCAAPQLPRRDLQAELAEPLRVVLQDLLRRPLSFHGEGLPGGEDEQQGENGTGGSHGRVV